MAKKRNEEEITATLAELPQDPPETVLNAMKGRQKEERLVYRAAYQTDPLTGLNEPTALVTCTACGESYHLGRSYGGVGCHSGGYGSAPFGFYDDISNQVVYSGEPCTCPECEAAAKALHVSGVSRIGTVIDKSWFMTIHAIRRHFVALGWILFKEVYKDGRSIQYAKRGDGFMIIDRRMVRLAGYKNNLGGASWTPRWEARARWEEVCDEYDISEIYFDVEGIMSSEAANSAIDYFVSNIEKKIRVGAYMTLWNKYPQIENLVRSGLAGYVAEIIADATRQDYGYYGANRRFSLNAAAAHLNVKEVKPHRMLGIDKEELPLAKKYGMHGLEFYKKIYETSSVRLTGKQIETARKIGFSEIVAVLDEARVLGAKVGAVQTINYLRHRSSSTLIDYWRMIWEAEHTLPESRIFPKDLQRRHDEAVMQKKVAEDEMTSALIRARAELASWMAFEDKETGLFIRPAESHAELIHEGQVLNHCVRTYAQSVARGETMILFIRRLELPDLPYFTLEFKDGKVNQNRGLRNCDRTPEVNAFEKKWLQYLEDTRNGKRTSEKQAG